MKKEENSESVLRHEHTLGDIKIIMVSQVFGRLDDKILYQNLKTCRSRLTTGYYFTQ